MTVATRVSSTSSPDSFMANASTAMIWSPSMTLPSASTARQRSASPSWAMPSVGALGEHRLAQAVEVGGAAAVVDVLAVGQRVDRDHLGARLAVGLRGGRPGGAVRAVDDHAQAVEAVRDRLQQVGDVAVERVGDVVDPADARAGRAGGRGGDLRLDLVLDDVGQLVPARGEQLDAVVRHGVVRRGDHHAEVGAQLADQVRDGGGRQHADLHHVRAGRGQPGGDGRLQHLAAGPRVPADDRDRPVRAVVLDQHPRGRRGDGQRQLRGQLGVRQATNTVGTEQASHRWRNLQ